MPLKKLLLLGWPAATLDEGELPLGPGRPTQLLACLALGGAWQPRDALARLFWPDSSDKIARSNLRNLLHKAGVTAPWAPVEATEHALRLRLPTDVDDFHAAVQRGDAEAAVRIGTPGLLLGYEAHASEPYLQWLQAERETLRTQWRRQVQALLALPGLPPERREALAEGWAQQCPHDEEAVQARLALAFERGQPAAALRLYRDFEARLLREFGVRPSRALEQLALQAAAPVPAVDAPPAAPIPTPTPAPRRPRLFGRRLELQQMGALLADDGIRLVTLMGPGGVGKSTLLGALHEQCLARQLPGVCGVDTAAAPDAQGVIAAIAAALRIASPAGDAREVDLAATLRERPCLLLLDGAEQPGLAGPLALLLDRCPGLRIVLAARRRLQLDFERVVTLDGFPLPDAEETDAQVLATNDAVACFLAAMQQAGQVPDLARDTPAVAALVRAVDGLPLALKLLARLTPLFSLQQLLDSVRQHVQGGVGHEYPAIGELMPALVASFQRSWAVLAPAEQAALARLAVFPAPFDVAAARAVGRTGLPVITSLVDASLLRSGGAGRLSMHAAIRACVQAVAPQPAEAVADYLEHYRQRVAAAAAQARSRTMRPLRQLMDEDGLHVDHAWHLAVQRRELAALQTLTESLWFTAGGYGRQSEWNARFSAADAVVRDDPRTPPALLALLAACTARATYDDGHFARAADLARAAMRLSRRRAHRDALLFSMDTLVRACLAQSHTEQAQALMLRFAALNRGAPDDDLFSMVALTQQRILSFAQSRFEENLQLADRLLALRRRIEDADNVVLTLLSKAFVCATAGDLVRAIAAVQEVVDAAECGDAHPSLQTAALYEGTMWLCETGRLEQAGQWLERANALAFSHPQPPFVRLKSSLVNAAHGVATGRLRRAARSLADALDTIGRGKVPLLAGEAFLCTARWLLAAGDRDLAVALLRAIAPATHQQRVHAVAQALLGELGEAQRPQAAAAAQRTQSEAAALEGTALAARRRVLELQALLPPGD